MISSLKYHLSCVKIIRGKSAFQRMLTSADHTEGTKLVCRKTLMHINKGKAYGRQVKASTGLNSDPLALLPSYYKLIAILLSFISM